MEMKSGILAGMLLATVVAGPAFAQGAPIKLANVAELSGGGATVGTNWKNGIDLAIEEINAKGGILGKKIDTPILDTQSDAGISRTPCCSSEALASSSQAPSTSSLSEYAPASPVLVEARVPTIVVAAVDVVANVRVEPALVRVDTGPPIRIRTHSFLI